MLDEVLLTECLGIFLAFNRTLRAESLTPESDPAHGLALGVVVAAPIADHTITQELTRYDFSHASPLRIPTP